MQIIFSHKFGTHSKSQIIYSEPELISVQPHEHDQCLDQGWLATAVNGQARWYQSRSTRVNLSVPNYSQLDNWAILNDPDYVELDALYTKYCQHKHYKKYFEIDQYLPWDSLMGYYVNGQLSAYTKLRRYSSKSIETVLFVWDYKDPQSHLGLRSLEHECAWSESLGYKYLYLGPGYEKNSIYKSSIPGFEFWTGSYWSSDLDHYIWLCRRDSHLSAEFQRVHNFHASLQHDYNSPDSTIDNSLTS
jgi:hypothetical protein